MIGEMRDGETGRPTAYKRRRTTGHLAVVHLAHQHRRLAPSPVWDGRRGTLPRRSAACCQRLVLKLPKGHQARRRTRANTITGALADTDHYSARQMAGCARYSSIANRAPASWLFTCSGDYRRAIVDERRNFMRFVLQGRHPWLSRTSGLAFRCGQAFS